jgi:transcriptional regulator with XRE-family HTH domain
MGREITEHQSEIYELRRQKRWSFAKIAGALGITRQAAHDAYKRALTHVYEYNQGQDLPEGVTIDDMYRVEELEYIEGVLERYMRLADDNESKKPRTSIEALNGAHRYLDSLIKIKGINAAVKVEHKITIDDLRSELLKIESQVGEITDAEVVEVKQIGR